MLLTLSALHISHYSRELKIHNLILMPQMQYLYRKLVHLYYIRNVSVNQLHFTLYSQCKYMHYDEDWSQILFDLIP